MVMAEAKIFPIDSTWDPDFNRPLDVIQGDRQKFIRNCTVTEEAETSEGYLKTKFADLPSAGIWADRTESDDELLEELGSGWRGFAAEQ